MTSATTLAIRLKQAREKKKLSQEALASRVGIKQQAVQRIEVGKVKSTGYVVQLARALNVTPDWLALGEEPAATGSQIAETKATYSIAQTSQAPLLSLQNIEEMQSLPLKNWAGVCLPILELNSDQCFALQIKDNSMSSGLVDLVSFTKNDYIIAEANRQPVHNDFVIAKLPDSAQAAFRRYVVEGNNSYLKPINPQYATVAMKPEIKICGVVFLRYSVLDESLLKSV
jgi:SOS-response transcriptional repressor LexA